MKPLVKRYVLCDHLHLKPMSNPIYNQDIVYLASSIDPLLASHGKLVEVLRALIEWKDDTNSQAVWRNAKAALAAAWVE